MLYPHCFSLLGAGITLEFLYPVSHFSLTAYVIGTLLQMRKLNNRDVYTICPPSPDQLAAELDCVVLVSKAQNGSVRPLIHLPSMLSIEGNGRVTGPVCLKKWVRKNPGLRGWLGRQCLPRNHEDLSSDHQSLVKPDMVALSLKSPQRVGMWRWKTTRKLTGQLA